MTPDASRGVDKLLAAAGIDAADGVQLVAASRLSSVPFDPSLPLLILRGGPPATPPLPVAMPAPGRSMCSALSTP